MDHDGSVLVDPSPQQIIIKNLIIISAYKVGR
jgi:hypothetical protein